MPDPTPPTTPRRPRSPQGSGGRLRDELIAAATRLLAESADDDGVSLRAVARAVGIAAPSVYLHFPSREALLEAVQAEQFAALRQATAEAAAGHTEPAARLFAGCLAYCRFAAERPGAYRVLFGGGRATASGAVPGYRPWPGTAGESAFGVLVDLVAACLPSRQAPPGDAFAVATDVWAAMHGMVGLRRARPRFPWPPLEEQLRRMLAGLVGGDAADPNRPVPQSAR